MNLFVENLAGKGLIYVSHIHSARCMTDNSTNVKLFFLPMFSQQSSGLTRGEKCQSGVRAG